jgi:hypothetical protein
MAKQFSPIAASLDGSSLSLLGFDITDARARLGHEYDEWDGVHSYDLHWSIRGRFDQAAWKAGSGRTPQCWSPCCASQR